MILAIIKLQILLKLPTAMQPDKEESMKSAVSEIAHVANHLNAELNKSIRSIHSKPDSAISSPALPSQPACTDDLSYLKMLGVGNDMYIKHSTRKLQGPMVNRSTAGAEQL